jgi:hypothetical protein
MEVARREGDQLVAVAHRPLAVDRDHPVGVTVEREPDLGVRGRDPLGEPLRRGCAAAVVDVAPVRLVAEDLGIRAESPEDGGTDAVRRAVRAVEHHAKPGEVEREGRAQLAHVVVGRALERPHRPDAVALRIVDDGLDRRLGVVVQLAAGRSEELDAVVGVGVVRGGHDRGEVESEPANQDRCRGRGQYSAQHRVAPRGGDPGGEGGLQHRAGLPGVADDQDLRAVALRGARRRAAELGGQVRGQQVADRSPDPVGPEESALCHWPVRLG